jgi:hypothetical protein
LGIVASSATVEVLAVGALPLVEALAVGALAFGCAVCDFFSQA